MRFYKANEMPHQTEDCLLIPSALINNNRYRGIGSEAVILYAHLLDKSGLIKQAESEPITLYLTEIDLDEICRATVITRHKIIQALKKLADAELIILDRSIPA